MTSFRIIDSGGHPVPGARLVVATSDVPFPEVALIADDAGVVHVALPRGRLTFRAHGPEGLGGEVTVTGGDPGVVVVRMTRS